MRVIWKAMRDKAKPTHLFWLLVVVALCGYTHPLHFGSVPSPVPPADINDVPLSAADLEFGQQQTDQMLRDRKAMAAYVHKGDPIYVWVSRQLAGCAVRQHVYWSAKLIEEYPPEYLSYHIAPYESHPASIAVRDQYAAGPQKGQSLPGSTLWQCAVFELFNISHTLENLDAYNAALAGTISKAVFIEKSTRNEFAALLALRRFAQETWEPTLARDGLEGKEAPWDTLRTEDYPQWIALYTDPNGYPFNVFGKEYDELSVYRTKQEKYREDLKRYQEQMAKYQEDMNHYRERLNQYTQGKKRWQD